MRHIRDAVANDAGSRAAARPVLISKFPKKKPEIGGAEQWAPGPADFAPGGRCEVSKAVGAAKIALIATFIAPRQT